MDTRAGELLGAEDSREIVSPAFAVWHSNHPRATGQPEMVKALYSAHEPLD